MVIDLPLTYYLAVGVFVILLIYGILYAKTPWGAPYCVVLCTIAGWYFIEPFYFPELFAYSNPEYVQAAYDGVLIFYLTFAIGAPVLTRKFQPRISVRQVSQIYVSAEHVLVVVALAFR